MKVGFLILFSFLKSVCCFSQGYNGKQNIKEWSSRLGGAQLYGFRIKFGEGFLSVDPLMTEYAYWSPYAFAGNTPIQAVDIDGREVGFAQVGGAGVIPIFRILGFSGSLQIGLLVDMEGNYTFALNVGFGLGIGSGGSIGLSGGAFPFAETTSELIGSGVALGFFTPVGRTFEVDVSFVTNPESGEIEDYRVGGTIGPASTGISVPGSGLAGYINYTITNEIVTFTKDDIELALRVAALFGINTGSLEGLVASAEENLESAIAYKEAFEGFKNKDVVKDFSKSEINASKSNEASKYVIKKGDSLTKIAKKFSTTVEKLQKDNNIKDKNKIGEGDVLIINNDKANNPVQQ